MLKYDYIASGKVTREREGIASLYVGDINVAVIKAQLSEALKKYEGTGASITIQEYLIPICPVCNTEKSKTTGTFRGWGATMEGEMLCEHGHKFWVWTWEEHALSTDRGHLDSKKQGRNNGKIIKKI